LTSFKWERTGDTWRVFGNEPDPDTGEFPVIWELENTGVTMTKQTVKKEMKIFLKLLKKPKKVQPDETGDETDD